MKNETRGNVTIVKFGGIRDSSKNECGMTKFNGGLRDEKNLAGAGFVQFDVRDAE